MTGLRKVAIDAIKTMRMVTFELISEWTRVLLRVVWD